MDLQGFSSIFELFASFALAYIVIDELTDNPFILTITEKIFRKYKAVDNVFEEIRQDIAGQRKSITEIPHLQLDSTLHGDYQKNLDRMDSTETKFESSHKEIRKIIQSNYATRVFSHLNCYLFLYCLTMLFFGGVYSSNEWYKSDKNAGAAFQSRLDTSLFFFFSISLAFIVLGWAFDSLNKQKKLSSVNKLYGGEIINGFVFSFLVFLVAGVMALISFYTRMKFYDSAGLLLRGVLIVGSILLPVFNFLIYIWKATSRADNCKERVLELAEAFKIDYDSELGPVRQYISACAYHQSKITVTSIISTELGKTKGKSKNKDKKNK